jgi:mannose-6-phosphate isomerase-like protein (cupin superfamily)
MRVEVFAESRERDAAICCFVTRSALGLAHADRRGLCLSPAWSSARAAREVAQKASGPTLRSGLMKYAKKNLREVQDSAVQHGLSQTQEARFPQRDLGAEQSGMNFLIVKPRQREAFAHRHRTAEEIYVVLAGTGRVKLDDELINLNPLDAVRVSPGVTRSFEAGPDGLQVLIFGPHVESDGEMVPDFWSA